MKKIELFERFRDIRARSGQPFYDTHVHPHEVFGFVSPSRSTEGKRAHSHKFTNPNMLERLHFNNIAISVLESLFLRAPKYIKKTIQNDFFTADEESLAKVLEDSSLDSAVLVPIYPEVNPASLYESFRSSKFIKLGSADISLNESDMIKDLEHQIKSYSIVGIKLHPNIQSFYPHPSLNPPVLGSKLNNIYRFAQTHHLYILFHGGISFVPSQTGFEKRTFALIKNFFASGKSFLNDMGIPVVIAHLGLYNVKSPQVDDIRPLAGFEQVCFDTAGINSALVHRFLKTFGPNKLLFGSDTFYFNLKYQITNIVDVLFHHSEQAFEENVLKVFSKNYISHILEKR